MNISLSQAVEVCQASLIHSANSFNEECLRLLGASSDNRAVKEGDIFVCIRGQNVDGHSFAEDAYKRGAVALIAEYNPFSETPPLPLLIVKDSVQALMQLAHAQRLEYAKNPNHKVVGITGTAGKTSLKELLSHILSLEEESLELFPQNVAKNPLNKNTQIGMSIAILNASGEEKFWVFEAGISHPHDMDELGAILEPDIALVLNVGHAHTEGLGEKGVAYHKAQICKYLRPDGIAFINNDYPELMAEAKKLTSSIIAFTGSTKESDNTEPPPYFASYTGLNKQGLGSYTLSLKGEEMQVSCRFIGSYGAENCIAAASIAYTLGFSLKTIQYGIETMPSPIMRFNCSCHGKWTLIDDSYNANPLSTLRMLEAASELSLNAPLYAVLGEMKELGTKAEEEHINLGKAIAQSKIQILFWVGEKQKEIEEGLQQENYKGKVFFIKEGQEIINPLKECACSHEKAFIFFKGSRSNHLEKYVDFFIENCHAI